MRNVFLPKIICKCDENLTTAFFDKKRLGIIIRALICFLESYGLYTIELAT